MEGGYFIGVVIGSSLLMVPAMALIAKGRGRSAVLYAIITFVWMVLWLALAGSIVLKIAVAEDLGVNRYTFGLLLGPGAVLLAPLFMLLLSGGRAEPHLTEEEILAEMERIRAENERYQDGAEAEGGDAAYAPTEEAPAEQPTEGAPKAKDA